MLEVKNITKVYGEQRAVDNASFTITPGEIVGLLGPNGAGKSTLMKIITCFLPPTEGTVSVYGYDIFDDPVNVRRQIGYLPEQNPLYTDMYVREFLRFVAGVYQIPHAKERVEEMIALTGLTPESDKRIMALSKGYRQRVGLAQALIHDPKVLILDEPTTGLDPNQLEEIRSLIRNVGKTKIVLLSTHIMQEVEAMCSRAIIIHHGKIIDDELIKNFRPGEMTQRFHALTQNRQ
ncbi:MAG: ATP-binding cassette domain-containing protein [Bacteroidales bacterium]|nr:ATP-binding cassette domain-containing protein [Bacteroidales bacterium]